jgi:hypothetical protein
MLLPLARGPVSAFLTAALRRPPGRLDPPPPSADATADPLGDEDLQLSLFVCYELHYRGFEDVDDGWEWEPDLIRLRSRLERQFETALRAAVTAPPARPTVATALAALVAADDGPSLSGYLHRKATHQQFVEFVLHRSIYHLKEADAHTWAIPRLHGRPKAALVEIQADEYGGGRLERMHQTLFADTMRQLGLDAAYGAYLDVVPGVTLATGNVISLFGLHRRLRGALAGHLAAFEMTSSEPNRRYGNALRRLGGNRAATAFYDEHVTADAVHEQIAAHDLCGALVDAEPGLADDVMFGAASAVALDARVASHLLRQWARGRSSLRSVRNGRPVGRPA